MSLFTDWSLTDPHYFWIRGALWGFVLASMFWKCVITSMCKMIREHL